MRPRPAASDRVEPLMTRLRSMPRPVLQRLPQYLWYVREQREQGVEFVSSREIAYSLGITPSCVRQDFTHLKIRGISKRGYKVELLDEVLTGSLAADKEKRVAIVGAGHLGQSLAVHGGLARYGFRVCAILDIKRGVIGRKVGHLTVRSMDDLPDVVREEQIDIGLIAVPAESAQKAADRLILCGVTGLLNLALTRITARRDVHVVNSRIVADLLMLSSVQAQTGQLEGRRKVDR